MRLFSTISLITAVQAVNVVLTNDDGWAVAIVRAQNNALKAAGYNASLLRRARLGWVLKSVCRSYCQRRQIISLVLVRQLRLRQHAQRPASSIVVRPALRLMAMTLQTVSTQPRPRHRLNYV
jgi:hypothetical protein